MAHLNRSSRSSRFLLPLLALLGWLLAWGTSPVLAAPLFDTPAIDRLVLGKGVEFLEDPEGALTLDQVRRRTQPWTTNQEEVFNKGYNRSTWWLRFDLHNDQAQEQWLLEIVYPVLDHIEVHVIPQHGESQHFLMGGINSPLRSVLSSTAISWCPCCCRPVRK